MRKSLEESTKDSTWNKAAPHEPLFIIRAKDVLAPAIVRRWIVTASRAGVPDDKLSEARYLLDDIEDWQRKHGSKVPD